MKQRLYPFLRLAAIALLVLAAAGGRPLHPAQADSAVTFLANADLSKLGVERPDQFWPIQLTRDGRTLVAVEDMKGASRSKGVFSKVWIVRFNADTTYRDARSIPLRMPPRLQNILTPDEMGMVIMTREGTSFWYLDLASGDLREFVHPGLGKTRWVSDPDLLWVNKGTIWTMGYPMDANGTRGNQTLATVDPTKEGAEAIQPSSLNIFALYDHFESNKPLNGRWVNPDLGFLGGFVKGQYTMTAWTQATGFKTIGTFKSMVSMLGLGTRLALVARQDDGTTTAQVYDAETGQKWVAPSIKGEYNYPFISETGESLVLTRSASGDSRVDLLYGRLDKGGYDLKPLEGLQNKRQGIIRTSADGSHLVFRNPEGLYYGKIPQ